MVLSMDDVMDHPSSKMPFCGTCHGCPWHIPWTCIMGATMTMEPSAVHMDGAMDGAVVQRNSMACSMAPTTGPWMLPWCSPWTNRRAWYGPWYRRWSTPWRCPLTTSCRRVSMASSMVDAMASSMVDALDSPTNASHPNKWCLEFGSTECAFISTGNPDPTCSRHGDLRETKQVEVFRIFGRGHRSSRQRMRGKLAIHRRDDCVDGSMSLAASPGEWCWRRLVV